jgi:tetratricopeptide (TPR) repeat protein
MNMPDTKEPDDRMQTVIISLLLAVITFAVFKQTAGFDFVNFDDPMYVFQNPFVVDGLTLHDLGQAFGFYAGNWHPLTWMSHMLDCQICGLRPGGHHLTNVMLHTVTVVLLFRLLRIMTGALWRSAFVAAVFAIHPLRAESVAWVSERKDVLSGLFFVLTLCGYVVYVRTRSRGRYALALLCFALGLMCKPMLVTLPLVLLLLDGWPLQRKESAARLFAEKLPFFALSAVLCVVTLFAQRQAIQMGGSSPLPSRMVNSLASTVIYLKQMFWPAGLAAFYPFGSQELGWVVFDGVFVVVCTGVAIWLRRRQPWLIVGWAWYLVMLLPVLGIIQVAGQAHADRYTYLPQIGIAIALVWMVAQWRINRVAAGIGAAIVLTALAACAGRQVGYWRNSQTLWTHTLACTQDNYVAHYGLGEDLGDQGRTDEAMSQFQLALDINPQCPQAAYGMGNALMLKGDTDRAIAEYQTAIQAQPDHYKAYNNLGNAFMHIGKVAEAISCFKKALEIQPGSATAQKNLDQILQHQAAPKR